MSTWYSINLFFPVEHLRQALDETVKYSFKQQDINTVLLLPDHTVMELPIRPGRYVKQKEPIVFSSEVVTLNIATMCFPLDDKIQEYHRELSLTENNCENKGDVGYIDLSVTVGDIFAEFRYVSHDSKTNQLFTESQSIQETMKAILDKSKGLFCFIEIENELHPFLNSPQRKVIVKDWEEYRYGGRRQKFDVDQLVIDIKMQLDQVQYI